MDAHGYLHWLEVTDLEMASLEDLKTAVDVVVEGLKDEGADGEEMLAALQALRPGLLESERPWPQLGAFRSEFLQRETECPATELEEELRQIAAGLPKQRWKTETYLKLEKAVDQFLDGGEEDDLWDTLDELETLITGASQTYRESTILGKEVTMESQTTHRLLLEGMDLWTAVLARAKDEAEEPDWDDTLAQAEEANRILAAVTVYNERVQSALAPYSR